MWYELLYVEINIIFATEVLLKQTAPHRKIRFFLATTNDLNEEETAGMTE